MNKDITPSNSIHSIPRLFSGFQLKLFAVLIMIIDHAALCLIYNTTLKPQVPITQGTDIYTIYRIYRILRGVGRLAFPIFCFFLVEGFLYTRSRTRYAVRLLIFGILSEVPFDLCSQLTFPYHGHQNVMFELLMGLLMLTAWEYYDRQRTDLRRRMEQLPSEEIPDDPAHTETTASLHEEWFLIFCQIASAAAFMSAAQFLHLDYGYKGLGLILVLYLLRQDRLIQCAAGAIMIGVWELPAVLSFVLLLFYNGKRGMKSRWFFYAFYPVHLLVLYLIAKYLIM